MRELHDDGSALRVLASPPALSGLKLLEMCAHERYTALTADGWALSITRYQALGASWPQPLLGTPVLLVHGFSQNRHAWTAGDLVKALVREGLDVHILELRGHGDSGRAVQRARAAARGATLPHDLDYGWDFSDYFLSDVPTAIDAVKARTGCKKVAYCGHSMGGLIGYGLAARRRDLIALATIASPLEVGAEAFWIRVAAWLDFVIPAAQGVVRVASVPQRALQVVERRLGRRTNRRELLQASAVPMDWLLGTFYRSISFANERMPWRIPRSFRLFNPDKADLAALEQLLRHGEEKEPVAVLRTFLRWVRRGQVRCERSGFDIVANLSRIRIPALVIYGDADVLAGTRSTRRALERIDERYVRCVRLRGSAHIDLTMGYESARLAHELSALIQDARAGKASSAPGD